MNIEQEVNDLKQQRQSVEDMLRHQSRRILSILPKNMEIQFWRDREQKTIALIMRAFKPFIIFYLLFELCSLPLNYISTDVAYRMHDVSMTFIAYSAGWLIILAIYFSVYKPTLQEKYSQILAIAIFIGFSIVQISIFSADTLSMTWRGSLMIVFAYMFAYLCSGVKINHIFFSILASAILSYFVLIYSHKKLIEWVMFNIMILGNVVGYGLALLMISNERISFLQSKIIDLDQKIYTILNNHLFKLSQQDTLTLLGNRRSFEQVLNTAFQSITQEKKAIAILFIDVDYFKFYNDHYGHQQGDVALIQIAQTLVKYIDSNDTAIRYGGEEFVILLTDTTQEKAINMAECILNDIRNQKLEHQASKIKNYLTVSIGLTFYDGELSLNQSDVLRVADIALYQAKNNGRDQMVFLLPEFKKALDQHYKDEKSLTHL